MNTVHIAFHCEVLAGGKHMTDILGGGRFVSAEASAGCSALV